MLIWLEVFPGLRDPHLSGCLLDHVSQRARFHFDFKRNSDITGKRDLKKDFETSLLLTTLLSNSYRTLSTSSSGSDD